MNEPIRLRSVEFRREREAAWRALETIVDQVEKQGLRTLSAEQMTSLPMLYRTALSSLSVARAISLDRNVVEYLESLCARAWSAVYGGKTRLRDALSAFFTHVLPQTVRAHRWHVLLSALFLAVGTVAGLLIVLGDSDRFYSFVDAAYAGGRGPSASTESLRGVLYDDGESAADRLGAFASFLFTHNARIGILAFGLGFLAGIPVFFLLLMNGLLLGAFAALYHQRGLSFEFWGWVLPHGVTELLAVVLCGAGGLALGQALLFPGRHTRLGNLARRGREAAVIVMGAVVMLFFAGLIEGVFRQTVQHDGARYLMALATALLWAAYFGRVGRARR